MNIDKTIADAKALIREQYTRLSDTTNAEAMAQLYGDVLRFDHRRGRWLIWNEHRWEPDNDGRVGRYAIEAARNLYQQAATVPELELRGKVSRFAIQSENKVKLDAATGIAVNLLPIADKGEGWDINPMLLSCTNGIVDLSTGRLRSGKPEDRITMTTNGFYDPDATCPRWERFLNEVFQGDTDLVRYIQKALGYSITGDMREQVVFIGHGVGSNGKSVFFSTIREALGDYGYDAPFSLFARSQQVQSASNDLAALEFRRFVVSCEVLSSTRINELRLKKLSGGDKETARFLYREFFTFQPHCKIWLFVNHKPVVNDDSYGFWRRVRLIPFTRIFNEQEQDKQLIETLRGELPGILAWLVRGCLLWQKEGLSPTPSCVTEATKAYQEESDALAAFINERCEVAPDTNTKASELWKAYQAWANEQGYDKKEMLGSKTFYMKMEERFAKKIMRNGKFYTGIALSCDGSSTPFEASVTDQGSFHVTSPIHTRVGEFVKMTVQPSHRGYEGSPTVTSKFEDFELGDEA